MPNWTQNTIRFSKPEDLQKVLAYAKGEDTIFDFDKIIPEPRKIEDCPKSCIAGDNSCIEKDIDRPWFNWYEWHCAAWGTKWNACDPYETDDGKAVGFDTAWSSPTPIILRLAEIFKDVQFSVDSYFEDGGAMHYNYSGDGSGGVEIEEDKDEYDPEMEYDDPLEDD